MTYDHVIRNGRVIDPETGFDKICDVAIKDGLIAEIGENLGAGAVESDATGLIVCPGFIDLHAHGQSVAADRMQAFDGITTTLELEVGAVPVAEWYDHHATKGRVLNYGTAAAWILARKAVFGGYDPDGAMHPIDAMGHNPGDPSWSLDAASPEQTDKIVAMMHQGLADGAIGIGIPNGYAAGAGVKELSLVCDAAAAYDAPTFTHIANASNIDPKSSVDSYVRLIGLAGATGARMHICHLNSTSLMDIERVAMLVRNAQAQGLKVTTEAYPYGAGSTVVGAEFFTDPQFVERTGSDYSNIELAKNHERFESRDQIMAARESNPSDLVIWHFLDIDNDDSHQRMLDTSVTMEGGSIASDAMPWIRPDGTIYDEVEWPLPRELAAHPRSSATFVRFLRDYVRDRQLVPLVEGLAKCTIYPARVIEACAPQIARKARMQVGFDADIVAFDLAALADKADFADMAQPSEGVRHLLVGGAPVIADGVLNTDARNGTAIRRTPK